MAASLKHANQLPETMGSVAYDVYKVRFDGSSAAKPIPAALPEEKLAPKKQRAPKAKLTLAPFAAVGLAVVVFLLAMVIYSYVQLYETTNRAGELRQELAEAEADMNKLRSAYESKINLDEIEARAKELGMSQPTAKQTVYLNVAGADRAEVLQVDNRNFFEKAWGAVSGSFRGIIEYFR